MAGTPTATATEAQANETKAPVVGTAPPAATNPSATPAPAGTAPASPPHSATVPHEALHAERQKRKQAETALSELKGEVTALKEMFKDIRSAAPAPSESEEDRYVREHPDDPLARKIAQFEGRLSERERSEQTTAKALESIQQAEADRWLNNKVSSLKEKFPYLADVWRPGEDGGESERMAAFLNHADEQGATSDRAFEAAFKDYFFDDIVASREKTARDEAFGKGKEAAQAASVVSTQGGSMGASPTAFQARSDLVQAVTERLAASGKT